MTERYAKAFAEWMRRYQADPAQFAEDFASTPSDDYGDQAAAYFEKLLAMQDSRTP